MTATLPATSFLSTAVGQTTSSPVNIQRNPLLRVTRLSQALTSGEPSCFGLTPSEAACTTSFVDVLRGDRDSLLPAGLIEQAAVDHRFERFQAVAGDAFLAQIAHPDFHAVDDRGHARHPLPLDRIVPNVDQGHLAVQTVENVFGDRVHLAFAERLFQVGFDLVKGARAGRRAGFPASESGTGPRRG